MILDEASFSELSKTFSTTELLNYTVYTISADNLIDITNTVKLDGSVMVEFPSNAAGVKLIVYASYYRLSGAHACIPGQAPQSFIQKKQGLPVIISGGVLTQVASSSGFSKAQATLQSILSLPNVRQIPSGPIAPVLSSIGIQPLTKVSANQTWYTYWRQDDQNSYIYLYNDGNHSTGTVSFANIGSPFFLNVWTGEETPILDYTVDSGYTTIPFNLAPSQSIIVAFLSNPVSALPEAHVTFAPPPVLGFYLEPTGLNTRVSARTAPGIITTSENKQHFISRSGLPSTFALQNWT